MRFLLLSLTFLLTACGMENATFVLFSFEDKNKDVKEEEVAKPSVNPVSVTPYYSLEEAINNEARSEKNKKRDVFRNPKETLEFFGYKAGMNVVEIWPGGGWYTEVLAPLVTKNGGKFIAAGFDPNAEGYYQRSRDNYMKNYIWNPNKWGKIEDGYISKDGNNLDQFGKIDMILTFRNVHNWTSGNFDKEMFETFYDLLEKGGVLGVVEHRENESSEYDPKSGYVKESYVIKLATDAGFKLVALSEINANPKDTKDHVNGVWTLPPVLRTEDKEASMAIGESDRMTLKFVK